MTDLQALALAIANLYDVTRGEPRDKTLTTDQEENLKQALDVIRTLAKIQ